MAKQKNFFNKKWNERETLEKGAIIIGGAFITIALAKQIKKLLEPPLRTYAHDPAANIPPHLLPAQQTSAIVTDPRPLVDEIAASVIGYNFFYYPEIINRLADLSPDELKIAYNYWDTKYKGSAGASLTQSIKNEWAYGWDGSNMYQPAINTLENARLY